MVGSFRIGFRRASGEIELPGDCEAAGSQAKRSLKP
jgi:hypothetical protein